MLDDSVKFNVNFVEREGGGGDFDVSPLSIIIAEVELDNDHV